MRRLTPLERILEFIRIEDLPKAHIGIEHLVGIPMLDWPHHYQVSRWLWTGPCHAPRHIKQNQLRASEKGGIYVHSIDRVAPRRPYISIGRRNIYANRIVYSEFVRPLDDGEYLSYVHEADRHAMDVNPFHFEVRQRGQSSKKMTILTRTPVKEQHHDNHNLPIFSPSDLDLHDTIEAIQELEFKTLEEVMRWANEEYPGDNPQLYREAAKRLNLK